GRKRESLIIPGMGNQPVTILGMGKQPVTTPAMGKQATTMATVTLMPCDAIGMNGTTTIGGNNTTSLSCWSEADTIITTRDIGILHGDTIRIMSATITMDRFTPMAICCRTRSS